MITRPLSILALCLVVAGCAEFPALDRAIPASELEGPYPPLQPVSTLVAQGDEVQIDEGDIAALDARAAALRARAARLRRQ